MKKKWLWLPLITTAFLPIMPVTAVYAGSQPEITVISEIMFSSQEEYVPEQFHEEGDDLYELDSWELEPVTVKPRKKHIEQQVLYNGAEYRNQIPEKRGIVAEEDFSGLKTEEEYPMLRMKKVKEEWRDDFSFPVVFQSYGAEEYELGGVSITIDHSLLELEAYEEALLSEIGVTPENYRITKAVWSGAPYMDENDILCRNAVVSGRRKVTDYMVTYGGTVTFPEVEGFRCKAVYRLKEFERKSAEEKIITAESVVRQAGEEPSWIIKREAVVFAVSLLLILVVLLAAVYLIKKCVDKRRRAKEVCGEWEE